MGDDEDFHLHVAYASHLDMDDAFCTRMREAIAAGLENAPIGVVTTPGTKNPRYKALAAAILAARNGACLRAQHRPPASFYIKESPGSFSLPAIVYVEENDDACETTGKTRKLP
jgi:hypothetical protein